jgi:hypothetical protein
VSESTRSTWRSTWTGTARSTWTGMEAKHVDRHRSTWTGTVEARAWKHVEEARGQAPR